MQINVDINLLVEETSDFTKMGIESCGMLISAVHTEEGEEKLHVLMLDNHIPASAKMY